MRFALWEAQSARVRLPPQFSVENYIEFFTLYCFSLLGMKIILPMNDDTTPDPMIHCMSLIGGKWKLLILYVIDNGSNRFGSMQREIPKITKQMLSQQLRQLEADGLLNRKIYTEIPPRVEYSMTKRGRGLLKVVKAMKTWGENDLRPDPKLEAQKNQLALDF